MNASTDVSCHFYPAEMCPLDDVKCRANGYCPRHHALLPSAPPSIALAMMAWKLAWHRQYDDEPIHFDPPGRCPELFPTSATSEFYRILDRISAGEAP